MPLPTHVAIIALNPAIIAAVVLFVLVSRGLLDVRADIALTAQLAERKQHATLWRRASAPLQRIAIRSMRIATVIIGIEIALLPIPFIAIGVLDHPSVLAAGYDPTRFLAVFLAIRPVSYAFVIVWSHLTADVHRNLLLDALQLSRPEDGTLATSRRALADASIALGYPGPPSLRLIDSTGCPTAANACVIPNPGERGTIAVTPEFAGELTRSHQTAVFAHLLAKLASGEAARDLRRSALAAGPLGWMVDFVAKHKALSVSLGVVYVIFCSAVFGLQADQTALDIAAFLAPVPGCVLLGVIITGWLQGVGLHRVYTRDASTWDARALLALKDPDMVLDALTEVGRRRGEVRDGYLAPGLFFSWPVDTGPSINSHESRRYERLASALPVSVA